MAKWNPLKKLAAGPDLAGLREFIADKDRFRPLRFVGRTDEIDEIEASLGRVRDAGTAGLTQVVAAAPGAGKTALLRELAARWTKSKAARPVYLEASAFSRPDRVIKQMFLALEDPAAERFGAVETETEAQHAEGGVSAVVNVKAGGTSGRSTQRTNLPATFLDAFLQLEDRETPVVLLVDEAQLWGADQEIEGRQISSLLVEAHVNVQGLPLLIVAAGLGDAPEVMARRGASKGATDERPMVLGRLNDAEMREVCGAFFNRYRIAGGEERRAEWTEAVIAGTDGWPRHLTNALRGAAKALIKGEGDLTRSSLEDARASAEAFRHQYYYDQIRPFAGMPELLAEVIAELPEREGAHTSRAAIERAATRAYEETPRLARQMDEAEVFGMLLHKGLIQDFGQGRYACPIPSFRNYVEAFCAADGVGPAAPDAPDDPPAPLSGPG